MRRQSKSSCYQVLSGRRRFIGRRSPHSEPKRAGLWIHVEQLRLVDHGHISRCHRDQRGVRVFS